MSLAPLPILLPIPLFGLFVLVYHLVAPRFATEKQRAYVISTFSSATMSIASLPYVWRYVGYGFRTCYEEGQDGWVARVGEFATVYFATYLFCEWSSLWMRWD